ncbi:MAG TPA: protein kinase [Polyangiaceae bacterium]|nr:protein kinase [Polyangiaceae bacterium]
MKLPYASVELAMTEEIREGELLAGKYRVERELGQGGMGVVYLAKHIELDEYVALKLMRPEAAKSGEAVARFMREARSAAKIKSQHVVRVMDVGVLDGSRPFMAMEYLNGADLQQILAQRKRLPLDETAEYLLQALEALSEAHAHGITHRDLKPGNLFVIRRPDDSPVVKVLDFGISKVRPDALSPSSPLTQVSALVGSPLYMSPEQMKASRDVDQRADIWALGVILHELLTGEVPFKGESLPELCAVIVLESEPPRARNLVPELPDAIDQVIARCLARKVEERFANAAELARALAPFAPIRARVSVDRIAAVLGPAASLRGLTLAQSNPTAPDSATAGVWSGTTADRRGRSLTLILGSAFVLLLLVSVGVFALRRGTSSPPKAPAAPPVAVEVPRAEAPIVVAPVTNAAPTPNVAPTPTVTPAPVATATNAAPKANTGSVATVAPTSASPPLKKTAPGPATRLPKKPAEEEADPNPFGGRR